LLITAEATDWKNVSIAATAWGAKGCGPHERIGDFADDRSVCLARGVPHDQVTVSPTSSALRATPTGC
jgi:hypothetical protein